MKAILVQCGSAAQDSSAFTVVEQPLPEPGPRDLLVRVQAIGMNPVDTKVRMRTDGFNVLGWDAVGIVEKTGEQVQKFSARDRVFYAGDITRPGCNSDYHLVDERIAAPAPHSLSLEDAVAMPLTSITAWESLFERLEFTAQAGANRGRNILIIGGAGGVGSVATQLAHWAGLTVYATASRSETVDWCKKMGADQVLNHRNNLFEQLRATGAGAVDAIFCTTQMEQHWHGMAECIRPHGRIVLIDDPVNPLDITVFKKKSVSISWEFMFTRSMFATGDMGEQGKILETVAGLLNQGAIVTTRRKTWTGLTPENIRHMHLEQESGTMVGKQVLLF
ncbi:zinc-binding alcohol dehydrogenase family protein [Desulfofustis glycolicus]|uniref:Zinc-type alcohol dehydrogenase-like protein n=1 Tax=Desulfofustis glycolicus DSM 9705 TaxID=1121409 RepID=A0A1M5SIM0_9BACT|nr:zinc-binding alcohol dehydrogenase family protein [Desulfofustis glycolicus]MCB2215784.1 zinc-binding alcohol dehydrogenase family protein [Desulfobulbaceae bacterium]SHH38437.1 zinc-binding alcohol dehydrogenase family protein [Desulfofustis glycolicus DSM 9705]